MDMERFLDRHEAGSELADRLGHYLNRQNTLVLGLPRGGVSVAYEISRALRVPLDAFAVRKLRVPDQEELAFGAVASGKVRVFNPDVVEAYDLERERIEEIVETEEARLLEAQELYRRGRPFPSVEGKIVILADDGLATGATMLAGVMALRKLNPARIAAAVPVGSDEACSEVARHVDEFICLCKPRPFRSVGAGYSHFEPVSDGEVRRLLEASDREVEAFRLESRFF